MKITDLFNQEKISWAKFNINFFGVEPMNISWSYEEIQNKLNEDCDLYWNVDKPCKLAKQFNSGHLDKDYKKKQDNSYRLFFNEFNQCIDITAVYYHKSKYKRLKIAAIPLPCEGLTWNINTSQYTPRAVAIKDYSVVIGKLDHNTIRYRNYTYFINEQKFYKRNKDIEEEITKEEFFNNLNIRSKALLNSSIEDKLSLGNLELALRLLPRFESNSIFVYKFSRFKYYEELIINSNQYAQPTKNILLGINRLLITQTPQYINTGENLEGSLVRVESDIEALENYRTVVNVYNGQFKPAFTYTDTIGFFDAFKTVTTGEAGRQRLLLDNVVIQNDMLYINDNGKLKDMYQYRIIPQDERLSSLSEAPFCNNDKPKRIMMNAKLTSQAVPLKEEENNLTHRIKARVGFIDLEGYTYADSIVISESFAKRLTTFDSDIVKISKKSDKYDLIKDKTELTLDDLVVLYPFTNLAILKNYSNVKIDHIEETKFFYRIFLSWEVLFKVGDKITNLHGAKGTVGLILPDDKMPRLENKVGIMEEGPLEVLISGFSTMRRGSLGQIFEAWMLGSGLDLENDFIYHVIRDYKEEMEEYSNNSHVTYKGDTIIAPVGINYIMRVYHHTATKVSISDIDGFKPLKLGEMEKINLVGNSCFNTLHEYSLRSGHKYYNGIDIARYIEQNNKLPENVQLRSEFSELLRCLGYELIIDGEELNQSIEDQDTIKEGF